MDDLPKHWCRLCHGDEFGGDDDCPVCDGSGWYRPVIRAGWSMGRPSHERGQPIPDLQPYAIFDSGEWSSLYWGDDDGKEHGEIDWPFEREWGDIEHLEALGFKIIQA